MSAAFRRAECRQCAADGGGARAQGVQGAVVCVGPKTCQITLGVHPPGELEAARSVMAMVLSSFEIFAPKD
jgi:hypothetical protein